MTPQHAADACLRYFVEVVLHHKPEATLEEVIAWCAPRVHRLCPLDTPERYAMLRQDVAWHFYAVRADPSPGLLAQAIALFPVSDYGDWSTFDVLTVLEVVLGHGSGQVPSAMGRG